jgi:hypothetical protein
MLVRIVVRRAVVSRVEVEAIAESAEFVYPARRCRGVVSDRKDA